MVERIDVTEPIDNFITALKKDGLVIVKNFASYEDLDNSLKEVQPYLDNDKPWEGK